MARRVAVNLVLSLAWLLVRPLRAEGHRDWVILTLFMETPARFTSTIPEVGVPMLSWLGVGNLVSVLLPVGYEPLVRRWRQRSDLPRTLRWLSQLVLPCGLFYVADPVYGLPHRWFRGHVPAVVTAILGPDVNRSVFHIRTALAVWAVGSVTASGYIRMRGLRVP
jgi:hypothetical protein